MQNSRNTLIITMLITIKSKSAYFVLNPDISFQYERPARAYGWYYLYAGPLSSHGDTVMPPGRPLPHSHPSMQPVVHPGATQCSRKGAIALDEIRLRGLKGHEPMERLGLMMLKFKKYTIGPLHPPHKHRDASVWAPCWFRLWLSACCSGFPTTRVSWRPLSNWVFDRKQ